MADTPTNDTLADTPPSEARPIAPTTSQSGSENNELTDAGVAFEEETKSAGKSGTLFAGAAQTLKDEAGKLTNTGMEKAKAYAVDGKDKAGGALDEFAKLMTDAAGSVDEKLGAQYGDYARTAANSLSGFAETLRNKDVDELLSDARDLVKKSPAVAIGTAAAVGFVLARLVKSGLDSNDNSKA